MDNLGSAVGGVFVLSLFAAAFVFWVWTLVDAVRVPDDSAYRAGGRVVWVLVIVFTGFFGSIAYLVAGRPRAA